MPRDASVITAEDLAKTMRFEETFDATDPGQNTGSQDVRDAGSLRVDQGPATYPALDPVTGTPIEDTDFNTKAQIATEAAAKRAARYDDDVKAEARRTLAEMTEAQSINTLLNLPMSDRQLWLQVERENRNRETIFVALGETYAPKQKAKE